MINPTKEAAKLLKRLGCNTVPVNVDDIAKHLGAKVIYKDFDGEDDLSGMLFQDKDQTIIGVNLKHPENRRRFTIAHEIGHLVLHQALFQGRVHVDKTFEVRLFRDGRSKQGKDLIEIQANKFAAELLMPTEHIKSDLKNISIDIESDEHIKVLAQKYKVSTQAMYIKIFNVTNDFLDTSSHADASVEDLHE